MRNYSAKDVGGYIAGSDRAARATLREIRKIIKSAVPKAEEGISWGVPFYKYHGILAGFASFKDHVSFGLAFALTSRDRKMLEKKGYATGSKTVQIRFEQTAPAGWIRNILKTRAKMNEEKK